MFFTPTMWMSKCLNIYLSLSLSFSVQGFDGGLMNSPSAGQSHEESLHIHPLLITDRLHSSRDLPKPLTDPSSLGHQNLHPKDFLQEHQQNKIQT